MHTERNGLVLAEELPHNVWGAPGAPKVDVAPPPSTSDPCERARERERTERGELWGTCIHVSTLSAAEGAYDPAVCGPSPIPVV